MFIASSDLLAYWKSRAVSERRQVGVFRVSEHEGGPMYRTIKTTVRPKPRKMTMAGKPRALEAVAGGSKARKARCAKVKALLEEALDERLAFVWKRLCPFPIDAENELPDRQGIIEDLADFIEVLQPNLDGMKADQLRWLAEAYGKASLLRHAEPARIQSKRKTAGMFHVTS